MIARKSESGASSREDNPIKRYYAKPTRKNAINAFCCYCMGCTAIEQLNGQEDHLEIGFRNEIGRKLPYAIVDYELLLPGAKQTFI